MKSNLGPPRCQEVLITSRRPNYVIVLPRQKMLVGDTFSHFGNCILRIREDDHL